MVGQKERVWRGSGNSDSKRKANVGWQWTRERTRLSIRGLNRCFHLEGKPFFLSKNTIKAQNRYIIIFINWLLYSEMSLYMQVLMPPKVRPWMSPTPPGTWTSVLPWPTFTRVGLCDQENSAGVTGCHFCAWTCTGLQHVLSWFPSPLLPLPVYSPSLPHSGGSQVMSNPTETKQRGKGTTTSWQWTHTQMSYRLTSQPRVISKDGRAQANILTTTHEGPWGRTIALICAWIPDSQNQRHIINVYSLQLLTVGIICYTATDN